MSSKIDICNMALAGLNANRVTDIDTPTTNEEKLCNIFFQALADEVMMEGSWTSAIYRDTLTQTVNTPEFDFLYEYQLPVDPLCLKVLDINFVNSDYEYVIEGNKLLTDAVSVSIRFIGRNTSVSSWDPMLVRAMTARLRAELASTLTGDTRRAELELQKYIRIRDESLALNNQQGSKQIYINTTLIEDR